MTAKKTDPEAVKKAEAEKRKLDDELKAYYDLPCDSPYYKKSGLAKGGEPVGV